MAVIAMGAAMIRNMSARGARTQPRLGAYQRAPPRTIARKTRSAARSWRVGTGLGGLRTKCAQIIGVSVSDTAVETAIAKASVTENSRNTRPTRPVMNNNGMKAAINDMLIESTVNP